MTVSVAIAGASGYAGGELVRLVAAHPEMQLKTVTADTSAGRNLSELHPHLRALPEMKLQETTAQVLSGHDLVFFAMPHGQSGALAESVSAGLLVDCGADHRLESEAAWSQFYGGKFFEPWAYGLPELVLANGSRQRKNLASAKKLAIPGCNATAVTLALAPGLASGIASPMDVVASLVVGTSGAGRSSKPELSASEILGSARAYSVAGVHRHIPEILQNFKASNPAEASISFTPILAPLSRGILATVTARVDPSVTLEQVRQAWLDAYSGEQFAEVLPEGEFPVLSEVIGSNCARIGIGLDRAAGRLIAICAIDNLVKGTAGAAIQSANIALGLPEGLGLSRIGLAP